MTDKPGKQPDSRNFPAAKELSPSKVNPRGPQIQEQGHEPPPRLPTEHRQESPHHQRPGKKGQGGK